MEKQTITIYDFAREAAVSMATVSRVVNGNQNENWAGTPSTAWPKFIVNKMFSMPNKCKPSPALTEIKIIKHKNKTIKNEENSIEQFLKTESFLFLIFDNLSIILHHYNQDQYQELKSFLLDS